MKWPTGLTRVVSLENHQTRFAHLIQMRTDTVWMQTDFVCQLLDRPTTVGFVEDTEKGPTRVVRQHFEQLPLVHGLTVPALYAYFQGNSRF